MAAPDWSGFHLVKTRFDNFGNILRAFVIVRC